MLLFLGVVHLVKTTFLHCYLKLLEFNSFYLEFQYPYLIFAP